MQTSVVIPVYNEQENLPELIRRSLEACEKLESTYEIILIDDGSRDQSAQMISDAAEEHEGKIIGVLLNRNYGQHAAVMAGFSHARGDYVITLDADGRRQSVNAAFAHMLGYPRRVLLGRDFRTFTHPDDQAADDQAYRAFVSGQISSHQGEKRYVHQDGHTVWAHISVTALRDEHRGLKGFITIVEDITARVVAQRERRAAESRYRRLVDVTPDGIIVHRDDRILFANAAATHVFGAPNTTALLNTPLSRFFEKPHTEDARKSLALNRHLQAGQTLPRAQFRFQALSGTDVEVESTGVVVDFEGGPATLRVIRDISDRVLAERALQ